MLRRLAPNSWLEGCPCLGFSSSRDYGCGPVCSDHPLVLNTQQGVEESFPNLKFIGDLESPRPGRVGDAVVVFPGLRVTTTIVEQGGHGDRPHPAIMAANRPL